MFENWRDWRKVCRLLRQAQARCPWPVCGSDRWGELPEEKKTVIRTWAAEMLPEPYPMLTATQFLSYVRDGSRTVYEQPSFTRRKMLIASTLAYCLDGDAAQLDKAIDGIWCIVEESFWGVSAHNDGGKADPLPDRANPVIDLFAAQTACTLAIAVRLLKEPLDAVTPRISARVQSEIESRLFTPFFQHDDFWWMGVVRKDLNNWTPWILSSVLFAAAAVMDDDVRLSRLIVRCLEMLDRYLACIPEDGGIDEGAGYWNMAGGALLDCLECIRLMTGGQMNFYSEEKIRRIGMFPLLSMIGNGWHFNFADCDARPILDGERLYTYGLRIGDERLMRLGALYGPAIRPVDTPQMNRTLDALFTDMSVLPPPEPLQRVDLPMLQVWARYQNGLYQVVKGGTNGESHNHNDVGSFILFADGEPVVVDAGNMVYTAKTFSADRYALWNVRGRNHNIPMIGDCEQQPGLSYAAKNVTAQDSLVSMDLADCYAEEAGVTALQRTVRFGDQLIVEDDIELSVPQTVTWVLMTRPKPELLENGAIRLGKCMLHFPPQLHVRFEEIAITDTRMARSYPGSLWRLTLHADAAERHHAAMIFDRVND